MSASPRWRSSSSSGNATPPCRLASSCAWARVRLATSRRRTGLREMARRQFDGFACADQQHGRILQPRERFLRQAHRGGGDRYRVGTDAGVGARPLGGGEGLLEQPVEPVAERAGSRAVAQASFTWPRICGSPSTSESSPVATRNRCRTASRLGVPVEVVVQVEAGSSADAVPASRSARRRRLGDGVQFGPVAGGQQHHFAHPGMPRNAASASGRASSANATRSRRSTGAVWWLRPMRRGMASGIVQVLAISFRPSGRHFTARPPPMPAIPRFPPQTLPVLAVRRRPARPPRRRGRGPRAG